MHSITFCHILFHSAITLVSQYFNIIVNQPELQRCLFCYSVYAFKHVLGPVLSLTLPFFVDIVSVCSFWFFLNTQQTFCFYCPVYICISLQSVQTFWTRYTPVLVQGFSLSVCLSNLKYCSCFQLLSLH